MAQIKKSSKARSPQKRKPSSPKPASPKPTAQPDKAITALFTRKEGCTVRQYADAMSVTRQAASARLRRFAELGILTVASASTPQSLADLAVRAANHVPATQTYRAAKTTP